MIGFREKVGVTKNKLSNLTSFIILQSEEGYFNKNNCVNFSGEESKLKLSVVYNFFRNTRQNFNEISSSNLIKVSIE